MSKCEAPFWPITVISLIPLVAFILSGCSGNSQPVTWDVYCDGEVIATNEAPDNTHHYKPIMWDNEARILEYEDGHGTDHILDISHCKRVEVRKR